MSQNHLPIELYRMLQDEYNYYHREANCEQKKKLTKCYHEILGALHEFTDLINE